MMQKLRCADTDTTHLNPPCGACGNPIGVQADNYHWHLVDDNDKPSTAYHAACVPPMPD